MFEAIRLEGIYQMVCYWPQYGCCLTSRKAFLNPDLILTEGLFA